MRKITRISAGLVLSCIMMFGCGESKPPKAPDEVKLQLKWLHQAQFAGFYVAQEKGYYAKENIKVTFIEGGKGVNIAESVISGKADFGVMSPEDILLNRSQGASLIALAAIYRRSAVVFAAKADSGIVRPADFKGKRVAAGYYDGGVREFDFQFRAMMKKMRINLSGMKITPFDPAYTAFYNGEVDVTACYATSGLIKMRRKGLKLNLIRPDDYGIHFYSDTLATTDRLISENPDLVMRFFRASLNGWREAVEDYRQALIVVSKYTQNPDPDFNTVTMEAMLPLTLEKTG